MALSISSTSTDRVTNSTSSDLGAKRTTSPGRQRLESDLPPARCNVPVNLENRQGTKQVSDRGPTRDVGGCPRKPTERGIEVPGYRGTRSRRSIQRDQLEQRGPQDLCDLHGWIEVLRHKRKEEVERVKGESEWVPTLGIERGEALEAEAEVEEKGDEDEWISM